MDLDTSLRYHIHSKRIHDIPKEIQKKIRIYESNYLNLSMGKRDILKVFIERMQKLGIEVKLVGN
jgi:hypothetical protein